MPFWDRNKNRTSGSGSLSRSNIVDQHRGRAAQERQQQNTSNPFRNLTSGRDSSPRLSIADRLRNRPPQQNQSNPIIGPRRHPDLSHRESRRWYAPSGQDNPLFHAANPIPYARRLHEIQDRRDELKWERNVRSSLSSGQTTAQGPLTPWHISSTPQEERSRISERVRLNRADTAARNHLAREGLRGEAAIVAVGPHRPRPNPLRRSGTRASDVRQFWVGEYLQRRLNPTMYYTEGGNRSGNDRTEFPSEESTYRGEDGMNVRLGHSYWRARVCVGQSTQLERGNSVFFG